VIELRLFGTLQLSASDGRDLTALARRSKRAALLLYLAAAVPYGLHRRDTLLALFWPELDEARARSALSQALYVLRNALGEQAILTRGGDEVGIAREVVWCDVHAFETALDSGHCAEALTLYRGGLLNGFSLGDAPEFGRWVDQERQRLEERAAEAAWAWAEARAAAGDVAQAEHWARRAAALARADEVAVRRLMTFLQRQGNRVAALRAYEAFGATLREEYQLEPSGETQALAEAIRRERSPALTPEPLQPVVSSAPGPPERRPAARRWAWAGAMLGAALLAVLGLRASMSPGGGVAPQPPIRRIAVLPLANLTGDTAQDYFVEGLHDALVTELAKVNALSVISRTSVLGYRHTTKTVPEIAHELHVDAVVEGSVTLEGDSVRITAQLIAGPADRHLWADTYVKSRRNLLQLYADVTQDIAREVRIALTPEERSRLANARTIDPEAYDLYLKGKYHCESWAVDGFQRGIALLRRAIDQDPLFALPYQGLAACYADWAFFDSSPPTDVTPLAKAAATRALELDSTLGLPHATLAWIRFVKDLDFVGPDQEFRQALALSPGSSWIQGWYGSYLTFAGRFDEAIRLKRQAVELDPLSVATSFSLGFDLHYARRYDESTAELRRTLELDPASFGSRLVMAANYALKGMLETALAQCDSGVAMAPPSAEAAEACAWIEARAGRKLVALRLLQRMTSTTRRQRMDPIEIAKVYLNLGDRDRAVAWLRRAAGEHFPTLVFLKTDPILDPLRSDPRFQALLRELKMGS
jgi:DNA-binding SARP family transcriptional activator/TolB-like protein/Tfp pilus assembly protein PilF